MLKPTLGFSFWKMFMSHSSQSMSIQTHPRSTLREDDDADQRLQKDSSKRLGCFFFSIFQKCDMMMFLLILLKLFNIVLRLENKISAKGSCFWISAAHAYIYMQCVGMVATCSKDPVVFAMDTQPYWPHTEAMQHKIVNNLEIQSWCLFNHHVWKHQG